MSAFVVAAVLFSALLHAGWNGLLRHSTDRKQMSSWIVISTFVVCAPLLPFVGLPVSVWLLHFGFRAALHVLYLALLAKAYELNDLSLAYPIARGTSPLLVTVGAR